MHQNKYEKYQKYSYIQDNLSEGQVKQSSYQLVLLAAIVTDDSKSFDFDGQTIGWFWLDGEMVTNSRSPYQRTKQCALAGKSFSLFIKSSNACGNLSVSSSFSYSENKVLMINNKKIKHKHYNIYSTLQNHCQAVAHNNVFDRNYFTMCSGLRHTH